MVIMSQGRGRMEVPYSSYLGSDGSGSGLLPKEIHHVGGELVAGLVVLLQLLVVDRPEHRGQEIKKKKIKI